MIEYPFATNTPEWKEARRGVITASRAKDARRTDGLTAQQRAYVTALRVGKSEAAAKQAAGYKKSPTSEAVEQAIAGTLTLQFGDAAHTYAKALARERCGGKEPEGFEGLSQRVGHEEEQFAAIEYVAKTGRRIEEAFFTTTDDRKFGMSLDRWVEGRRRALEVKTMVSSSTLFRAMVEGDISEYRDQCLFGLWHFTLDCMDLGLWCPDLSFLHIVTIRRDEDEIQQLEDDMVAFDRLVCQYEASLRKAMGSEPATPPPWEPAATPAKAPIPAAVPAPTVAPGAIPAPAF